MIKWKSIVLVLLLVLTVFILDQPIFGQLRPLQQLQKLEQQLKTGQQQQTGQQQAQLIPGLCIPKPAGPAPKLSELSSMRRQIKSKPLAKLDQQILIQYFQKATQAMNVPPATPDSLNSFTLSPSNPVVPGKGFINLFSLPDAVEMTDGFPGVAMYGNPNKPGEFLYYVEFCFYAQKGFYLVNCDVDKSIDCWGYISLYTNSVAFQHQTISGQSDPQTGLVSLAVYVPQNCTVDIIFSTQQKSWQWRGCEIIPQQS